MTKEEKLMIGDLIQISDNREPHPWRVIKVADRRAIGPDEYPLLLQKEDLQWGVGEGDMALLHGIPLTARILGLNGFIIRDGILTMPNDDAFWMDVYIEQKAVNINIMGYSVYFYYVHTFQHFLRLMGFDELADNFKTE